MLAIDGVGWSDMAEEQVQTNMALMAFSDSEVYTDKTCSKTCLNNYETLKKQYDDLLAKQHQTKFEAATYKRGLDTQENDAFDFKIEKFDKASKDLDQLLENLSYSGLDEFKEPEFKGYGPENSKKESNVGYEKESDNSKENSDKSLVKEHESQINKKKELQYLEQVAKLSTYTTEPSQHFNCTCCDDNDYEESTIPLNEIDSQIPPSIEITPVLPTLEPDDSLIIGNKELSTIPEKESDEFIKSSVEELVSIPSESEDTVESDSDCYLTSCDDFSPINVYEEQSVTFSNPLFDSNDDFTSSDDEGQSECIVLVPILEGFTNKHPLKENDDLFDLESKKNELKKILYDDPIDDLIFDPRGDIDEIDVFLDIDIPTNIMDDFYDSKEDVLYFEGLLSDDTTPSPPPEVFLDRDPRNDYEESIIPLNEIISQLPQSIAITPVLPNLEPEDSLIMGNEELSTIPKKESDEFIKSSVAGTCSIPKWHRGYIDVIVIYLVLIISSTLTLDPFVEIPSGESKVNIEVLSLLRGNRLLDHGRLAYRCDSVKSPQCGGGVVGGGGVIATAVSRADGRDGGRCGAWRSVE
ncbi:hypothetical protein Tco_1531774 [Tanacetum coccineum]